MARRLFAASVIILLLGVLAGCVSLPDYRPDLPEDMGDKGLLVGQLVGIGRLSSWSTYTDVLVNDRMKGKVVNGFIAIPLSPGDYSLSGLYDEFRSTTGAYTTVLTTTLPVTREFSIRPKEVTNLGLIVLYPDPNDKENKKFRRFFVDNTEDMKHFLKTAYPQLAPKLRVDSMTLAPGDLMPANLLEALRKEIAAKEALASGVYTVHVAGDVGTVAQLQRDKDGKVSGLKLIEVPTVSNLQSETSNYVKDRFAFLTTNNRLFFVQNGKVAEKRPPDGLRAGKVFVFGTNDLVIVDDKFEIFTSADSGGRWQASPGFLTKDKVRVHASDGASGYYLYAVTPPVALFGAHGASSFRPVELPADVKNLALLRERPSGLFAERESSFWKETEKRPFFVRPAGKTGWETRSMPGINCDYISFMDADGKALSTACGEASLNINKSGNWTTGSGNRAQYVSGDGGKTWQKK